MDDDFEKAMKIKSLVRKLGRRNCSGRCKLMVILCSLLSMEGRRCNIYNEEIESGHDVCEIKIDDKWIVFDAMYNVPTSKKKSFTIEEVLGHGEIFYESLPLYYKVTIHIFETGEGIKSKHFWKLLWDGKLTRIEEEVNWEKY